MTAEVEYKVAHDMALTPSETSQASGYSVATIYKLKAPFVHGRLQLRKFWEHVHTLDVARTQKEVAA